MPEQKQPPTCPNCGKPLKHILWSTLSRYTFNPKTGLYAVNAPYGGTGDVKCLECGEDLSDIFEDGPANYKTPE